MENKIIIGNMKMYMNIDEIKNYLNVVDSKLSDNVIICPSNIYIPYFLDKNILVGVQNVYYEDNGAYTGEISVEQIVNMGIKYAIVGHSERRDYFLETDYEVNKKLIKILESKINVILCIGEGIDDRNSFMTENVLRQQIEISLNNVSKSWGKNIIIAYEPRWAIGTGMTPSNVEISDVIKFIKSFVLNNYGMNLKVVYGGSVNENNINILKDIDIVDGFMIGGCCTNANKFLSIINMVDNN